MTKVIECTVIDGMGCFSENVANAYADYSYDGFEVTNENTENSFCVRSLVTK